MPDTRLRDFLEGLRSLSQFMDCAVVDVNTRGFGGDTPLKVAVVRQDIEVVTDLLSAGADPKIPGEDDYTPLHHAVGRESEEIVRLLLSHGALTSPRDIYGHTPLDYAKDTPYFALLKEKTEANQPVQTTAMTPPPSMTRGAPLSDFNVLQRKMTQIANPAESVFSFIEATADAVDSGFRWATYDYEDRLHHHFSIFNGVGGIPIFLSAYFEATKNPRALELARGALTWAFQNEPKIGNFKRGFQLGKFGLAYSALCLSRASGRDEFSDLIEESVNKVLAEPPGPVTDFLSGEASNGWLFLQLWQKNTDAKYLEGAVRCGHWLEDQLITDDLGTHCLVETIQKGFGTIPFTGLAHGISGVAYFFACLYQATSDFHWKALATALLDTLIRHAQPARGGINWSPRIGNNELTRCQFSHGAAGIGLAFAKAAILLDQPNYLSVALQAGEATYQYGDFRANPTFCTGLAGGGELLVELYKISREDIWLERAQEFAQKALAYRSIIEGQSFWPTDTADCFSADFTYGASGIGYFFLRAANPLKFETPLM